ncbi:isoaspartyl peptidase/L-asparaginase [Candidatus Bipolaricaulota bacterium]|nr:isoaspartyl peptidase/L-asparaginase [Candidatus Bipolaricaulota bacterium]
MKLVVHGGAGKIPTEDRDQRKDVLIKSAERGLPGEGPVDAVEKAIRILENDPLFNAGYGGSFQLDGVVRLDAAVMRSDLTAGGVINVEKLRNPITLANVIRKDTPHVLLQGEGALELARELKLEFSRETKSPKAQKKWEELTEKLSDLSYRNKLTKLKEMAEGNDTVGAVALSDDGALAAGTSTGGIRTQMKGRVGDSPIIGSGLYCNAFGAVSTTGIGEAIIKVNLARELLHRLEKGEEIQDAAENAIAKLEELTDSRAGLIAIDSYGKVGAAFNTRNMQYVVRES